MVSITLSILIFLRPSDITPLDGMTLSPRIGGPDRNAASDLGRDRRRQTKGQPVAPVLPVELVVTILTPPGPCRRATCPHLWCNRHNSYVGNVLACRLFNVNRIDNR